MISDSVMLNYQTEKFQYWQQKIKTSCRIKSQRVPSNLDTAVPGVAPALRYRIEREI